MARTPAVSTQLKAAQTRIAELEKTVESEKTQARWARESRNEAQRELDGIHEILDVMPGSLPRDKADGYSKHSAAVRLASYLAAK